MENRSFDLRNVRRYLDLPLKIATIGHRPKNNWIHHNNKIERYYLSFVFKMEKPFLVTRSNGVLQRTEDIPHMSIAHPGVLMDTIEHSCRNELFFSYPAEAKNAIEFFNLHNCYFKLTPAFNDTLHKIENCLDHLQYPGVADRLDYLAIELANEAMIASYEEGREKVEMPDERIFLISNYFQIHYSEPIDLDALLKKHSLTRRTFYREWKKYYTIPPAQYLIDLRLKYASEQLGNSSKKIYEIAAESGFCDPMYFNHCFSKRYGCSPLAYRKRTK